mgnify:CR=1 FL=1
MNEDNLLHQMFTIQFKDENEKEWSDGARFNKLEKTTISVILLFYVEITIEKLMYCPNKS